MFRRDAHSYAYCHITYNSGHVADDIYKSISVIHLFHSNSTEICSKELQLEVMCINWDNGLTQKVAKPLPDPMVTMPHKTSRQTWATMTWYDQRAIVS